MKKIVLTFGLISGGILSTLMLASMSLIGSLSFSQAEVLGYTTIVLASLLIFFGVRRYRENAGGTMTFGTGFLVGLLITLLSTSIYVATWEFVYFGLMPGLGDKYAAMMVDEARADGKSQAEIDALVSETAKYKALYDEPLFNAAITFAEPFPVGLVVSLVSAAVLRRKAAA